MSHDEELDDEPTPARGPRIALTALLLAVVGGAVLMMRQDQDGAVVPGKPGAVRHQVLATSWGDVEAPEPAPAEAPEAEPEDERDPQVALRKNLQNLDVMIDSRR